MLMQRSFPVGFYIPVHLVRNKVMHSKGFKNRGITGHDRLAIKHVIFSERHLCQIRGGTCLFDAVKKKKKSKYFFLHVKSCCTASQTKQEAVVVLKPLCDCTTRHQGNVFCAALVKGRECLNRELRSCGARELQITG